MPPSSLPPPPGQRRDLLRRLAVLAAMLVLAPAALALDPPRDRVLLSITGRVGQANAGRRADFDLAMLDALPQHELATSTPWYKTVRRFSGPLLRDVLAAADARGSALGAVALNDYKVEIPFEDTQAFRVVLATRLDGKTMAVRERGPLFIVYPYDDSANLRSERYYNRSAWQLRTLDVR